VALPRPGDESLRRALGSRWWAIAAPASIAVVIGLIALAPSAAVGLSYLALVAVPPLAAYALAAVIHGGRPALALLVPPLFAWAWVAGGSLGGQVAALALSAGACLTLGWLLASVAPARWVVWGIYAMAALDTVLVVADLLQHPNAVLNAAHPAAELPRLQYASFGSARMGFGDLFIAALLGALLATRRRPQRPAALLALALALAFDLLFLWVNELPSTVPIALTLACLEWRRRPGGPRLAPRG
jgi:hypothetical protein